MSAVTTYASHSQEVQDTEVAIVPCELTAEGGYKEALSAEFFEEIKLFDGDDGHELDESWRVPVSWTTIKSIHKAIVAHASADLRDAPRMVKTSLILERAVLGKLKELAFEEGKTVTELMAELVKWRLSKGPK